MHKMVNGKRIELSIQEEKAMLDSWERSTKKLEEKTRKRALKEEKKQNLKQKIASQLEIPLEDMELLFK